VALQILLEERNVTRAAERLSVSQPALSKTLQKLRDSFEDELFTRTAHGLVPTPRAEELGAELPALLETVERVLGSTEFIPETFAGSFKLLLPPILCESLLPGLVAELHDVGPNIQVITDEVTPDYQDQLKKGEADFAAFVALETERDILAEPIAAVAPRCYMRVGHPLEDKDMDLKRPDPQYQHGGRCAGPVRGTSQYRPGDHPVCRSGGRTDPYRCPAGGQCRFPGGGSVQRPYHWSGVAWGITADDPQYPQQ
jgi:DNA-binding transcriptional LysR family regulator